MCGICGIYHQQSGYASPEQLGAMLDSIYHRGPDEDGQFATADGRLAMGMRRLSIIDLAGGTQPIYNEDQTIAIVFNGEIYNHQDLRRDLEAKGHRFRTNSDTEAIVHLYEEYGVDCVKRLRGMFGFSIWDSNRDRLLIARDHLGIKPIYYTRHNGQLIYSSEIKAILHHLPERPSVNLEALSDFLSLRYVPAPNTLFNDIYALLPGHRMICTPDDIHIESYWDVDMREPSPDETRSEASYLEELGVLLQESVKMRLMSDVPFGAFLSGGVDSSTVVALMSQYLSNPVKTFSVGFEGAHGEKAFSELPYARQVAEHYQTDHHDVLVSADDFITLTEKVSYHLDQPLADYAEVGYFKVCDLASQHVKMVLTGEGGDELFAGYGRYTAEDYAPYFKHIPTPLIQLGSQVVNQLPRLRRAKTALYTYSLKETAERHINWIPNFSSQRKQALLRDDIKRQLGGHETRQVFQKYMDATAAQDMTNKMLYTDTKVWLPDYLLSRGDKLTMAVSLEGRVPMLDVKLVEFAVTVPTHLKIKDGTRKYLLKQYARTLLPSEIIDRKKAGFPVPVPVWLQHQANDMMHDLLADDVIRKRGYFNPDYVARLISEHERSFADHATMLYGLMNLELWHRQFIDQTQPTAKASTPLVVEE